MYKNKLDQVLFTNRPHFTSFLESLNEYEWRTFLFDVVNNKNKNLYFVLSKGNTDLILEIATLTKKLSPVFKANISNAIYTLILGEKNRSQVMKLLRFSEIAKCLLPVGFVKGSVMDKSIPLKIRTKYLYQLYLLTDSQETFDQFWNRHYHELRMVKEFALTLFLVYKWRDIKKAFMVFRGHDSCDMELLQFHFVESLERMDQGTLLELQTIDDFPYDLIALMDDVVIERELIIGLDGINTDMYDELHNPIKVYEELEDMRKQIDSVIGNIKTTD